MSAAVVSTSVIGSAATRIQAGGGSAAASRRTSSRNVEEFAKMSGASNRYTTSPGTCSASGYDRRSCQPRNSSTLPSSAA